MRPHSRPTELTRIASPDSRRARILGDQVAEVDDVTVALAPLDAPRSLACEVQTKQNVAARPFTTKRGETLDAFALSPEIGQ
jgi:hypothetical protein